MKIIYNGIDHVLLAAPTGSEERAREFFGKILGMKEIPKPANLAKRGGVWFKCGDQEIHIGIQKDFIPAKKAHPAFSVENLQELRRELLHKGIKVTEDEPLEGAERFFVQDPFGNRIEFVKRIY